MGETAAAATASIPTNRDQACTFFLMELLHYLDQIDENPTIPSSKAVLNQEK